MALASAAHDCTGPLIDHHDLFYGLSSCLSVDLPVVILICHTRDEVKVPGCYMYSHGPRSMQAGSTALPQKPVSVY